MIYCALQDPPRALTRLNVSCTFNTGLVSGLSGRGVSASRGRLGSVKSEGGGARVLEPAFRPPGQTDRQGGRLLTRMVDWFPGANPGQFPHLPGLGIRTQAGHGGSLGRVVTVVVTELVLLLSLGVVARLEVSAEPARPTELSAGRT